MKPAAKKTEIDHAAFDKRFQLTASVANYSCEVQFQSTVNTHHKQHVKQHVTDIHK